MRDVSEESCLTDALDGIIAGLFEGEQGAGQDPPPETPPPSPVAVESEQASDAPEPSTEATGEPETPTEDPAVLAARLAEIESELNARKEQEAQEQAALEQRQAYEAQLRAWQAQQQQEQEAQQLASEFDNVDPDWGRRFRTYMAQTAEMRNQAWGEAATMRQGLTAMAKAAEHLLTPEQFSAIAALSEQLVALPEPQMDQTLTQQRQIFETQREQQLRLEKENTELRLRIEAMSRPIQADAVDAGASGGPGSSDWQERPDFDSWFEGLVGAAGIR